MLFRSLLESAITDIRLWCELRKLKKRPQPRDERKILNNAVNAFVWLYDLCQPSRIGVQMAADGAELDLKMIRSGMERAFEDRGIGPRLNRLRRIVDKRVSAAETIDRFGESRGWHSWAWNNRGMVKGYKGRECETARWDAGKWTVVLEGAA